MRIRKATEKQRGVHLVNRGAKTFPRVTDSGKEKEKKRKDPTRIDQEFFKMKKPKMKDPFKM